MWSGTYISRGQFGVESPSNLDLLSDIERHGHSLYDDNIL